MQIYGSGTIRVKIFSGEDPTPLWTPAGCATAHPPPSLPATEPNQPLTILFERHIASPRGIVERDCGLKATDPDRMRVIGRDGHLDQSHAWDLGQSTDPARWDLDVIFASNTPPPPPLYKSLCVSSFLPNQVSRHQIFFVKCWLYPENTIHSANVGLMLGQRRRRWANIKPTLAQWIVFAGDMTHCDGPIFIMTFLMLGQRLSWRLWCWDSSYYDVCDANQVSRYQRTLLKFWLYDTLRWACVSYDVMVLQANLWPAAQSPLLALILCNLAWLACSDR